MKECPSCLGLGYFDIGDCEDGVIDDCPSCDGSGVVFNEDTSD